MSNASSGNKTVLIIVLLAVILIGGFYLYKESQSETVGISIGDMDISATVDK